MRDILKVLMRVGLDARLHLSEGRSRDDALDRAATKILREFGESSLPMARFGPHAALAWCESGFPSIAVGHRLAASFMCTAMTPDLVGEVRPPWGCFHVAVPPGVMGDSADALVMFGASGEVRVLSFNGQWAWVDDEISGLGAYVLADRLSHTPHQWEGDVGEAGDSYLSEHIKRSLLLARAVVGCCIELDTPRIRETIARDSKPAARVNKRGEPRAWSFNLSRDVRVDLRDHVRTYLTGARGGKLNVQHLVRGHWRRVAVGAQRENREWVHIEPYWRGDDCAPLPLRSHQVNR